MKTQITLFALILFSSSLFGQKFVQEWYIDLPGLQYSQANAIISTHDGHLFIAGPNAGSTGGMFFMETDTAGNVIQLTSAEEQFNNDQIANSLIEDKDNNFVMAGSYSYDRFTYFTRLSSEGEVLNTTVNGGQTTYRDGYDVEQTLDGGYLFTAENAIYGTGRCLALRKLDSLGHFIWDTTLVHPDGISPIVGIFSRMAKIDDSTFVITGKRNYAPGSGEDLDVLLTKIRVWDDSIQMLNNTIFQQDGTNEQGHDILVLPDNQGYIICGTGQNESIPNYTDGIIMRTDAAGNLIWKESFTRALYSYTIFLRVLLDEEENILVLAQTGGSSRDVSLLKYSLDGDLLQKQYFDIGLNETPYDMAISQNGKIFISAGATYVNYGPKALLLKVQDICPLIVPEAALTNTLPNMGEDVVVNVANTNNAWNYSLIQINGEITLSTLQGNGGILSFSVSNLTNEDVSGGLVVSVIEPGVDCIKYSDTLHLEFICPLETPIASLADETPFFGQDVVVTIPNTNSIWEYTLIQINGSLVLATSFGNGGSMDLTAAGLTNDDVSQGLVVSVAEEGLDCIVYSDTLHLAFVDGIEDRFQNSLQIFPNPFRNFITITDIENNKLSKLAVFNMNGQIIMDELLIENHQKIDLSKLPKGKYLLRITYKSGETAYRKVIRK